MFTVNWGYYRISIEPCNIEFCVILNSVYVKWEYQLPYWYVTTQNTEYNQYWWYRIYRFFLKYSTDYRVSELYLAGTNTSDTFVHPYIELMKYSVFEFSIINWNQVIIMNLHVVKVLIYSIWRNKKSKLHWTKVLSMLEFALQVWILLFDYKQHQSYFLCNFLN